MKWILNNVVEIIDYNEIKSDGVIVQNKTTSKSVLHDLKQALSLSSVRYDSNCKTNAQMLIRNRGTRVVSSDSTHTRTLDLNNAVVTNCELTTVSNVPVLSIIQSDPAFTKDLCQANGLMSGKDIQSIVESGFSRVTVGSNRWNMSTSDHNRFNGALIHKDVLGCVDIRPKYIIYDSMITDTQKYSSIINAKSVSYLSLDKDVGSALLDLSEKVFKGDYKYSFIINTEECEKNMDFDIESIGQKFLDLAIKGSDKISVHPICLYDYRSPIQEVSNFIKSRIVNHYKIGFSNIESATIQRVLVNGTVLWSGDFEFSDHELRISKTVNLKAGDIIKVVL